MTFHPVAPGGAFPRRIAIATDAWRPQVNGVVRTLEETIACLLARGHEVLVLSPDQFTSVPMPFYGEIRLAIAPARGVGRALRAFAPDIVHISTEGPIGWAARRFCLKRDVPFTSAFHTRFPDYAAVRTGLSPERFWPVMHRFHAHSRAVLCATPSLRRELIGRGIGPVVPWSRGIDAKLFNQKAPVEPAIRSLPGPILLYVGRVAPEKGLDAFLRCRHPGTKVVVGDGPALPALKARYRDAVFAGRLTGQALASAYASADCFVFPSRSDTFGLVMVEALATGLPVAGYPVQGPIDIVGTDGHGPAVFGGSGALAHPVGALNDDLDLAIARALACKREHCARYGRQFSWDAATDQFITALAAAMANEDLIAA